MQINVGIYGFLRRYWINRCGIPAIVCLLFAPTLSSQDFSKYDKFKESMLSAEHHMLSEGDTLLFSVDPSRVAGETNIRVGGVSTYGLTLYFNAAGEMILPVAGVERIRELKLPMMRIYGMNNPSISSASDVQEAIDRLHLLAEELGIPEENIVIEMNNGMKTLMTPEEWGDAAGYSFCRGYKFRYWEPANEPYYNQGLYHSADYYIQYVKDVSTAVKKANPDAQIVMDIMQTAIMPEWRYYLLDKAAGYYDCVAPHSYNAGSELTYDPLFEPYEDYVLAENWIEMDLYYRMQAAMDEYNPGAYLYETEWAMNRKTPNENADWQLINSTPFGSMHRIVRMIYLAQAGFKAGASSWMICAYAPGRLGFGLVPWYDFNKTTLFYWSYYYFNRHLGDLLPPITGECPYYTGQTNVNKWPYMPKDLTRYRGPATPLLVTMNEEKTELYMVLVNGLSDKDLPCCFRVENASTGGAESVMLTHVDPAAHPELDDISDWVKEFEIEVANGECAFELPRRSAVFIKMDIHQLQESQSRNLLLPTAAGSSQN